jgi:hypothetical protein
MLDGLVLYTPMHYNPGASDCILSPESICQSSSGLLDSWTQSGCLSDDTGSISIFDKAGTFPVCLHLRKNGLYYSSISSLTLDSGPPFDHRLGNWTVYFDDDGCSDTDISLELRTHPSRHFWEIYLPPTLDGIFLGYTATDENIRYILTLIHAV